MRDSSSKSDQIRQLRESRLADAERVDKEREAAAKRGAKVDAPKAASKTKS